MQQSNVGAILARVSTEDQKKGYSLPTQIEGCLKLAEREGIVVPEQYIFVEDESGKIMDRAGLRELRELLRQKAVAHVIVYDPDRLSRVLAHQLILAEEIEQRAEAKLWFVTQTLDSSPEGWLFFQMRGAIAEYELAKILERTQRGHRGRAQAGNVAGGGVKLGYRAIREPHRGTWEVDEEQAAIVRRMFTMALEGLSEWGIAVRLTRERVPTATGAGLWNATRVHRVLTYEGYTGKYYWGKYRRVSKTRRVLRERSEWIEVTIPAIVDEKTFQAVQRQLAQNKAHSPRNRKHDYLLTGGRLRCGACGRVMTGYGRRGKWYYRCSSVANVTDPALRCRRQLVLSDTVEDAVWTAVLGVLEKPELIAQEVQRQRDTAGERLAALEEELEAIAACLARCDRDDKRWLDAYAVDAIDVEQLKTYRADIAKRRGDLERRRGEVEAQIEATGLSTGQAEMLVAYCQRVAERLQELTPQEKRVALDALDIRASWLNGQPLKVEGRIPVGVTDILPS